MHSSRNSHTNPLPSAAPTPNAAPMTHFPMYSHPGSSAPVFVPPMSYGPADPFFWSEMDRAFQALRAEMYHRFQANRAGFEARGSAPALSYPLPTPQGWVYVTPVEAAPFSPASAPSFVPVASGSSPSSSPAFFSPYAADPAGFSFPMS